MTEDITLGRLLSELRDDGLLEDRDLAGIEAHLSKAAARPRNPWYLEVPAGLGAWLAALFLFGFVFSFLVRGFFNFDEVPMLLSGLGLIGLAVVVARSLSGTFTSQLALAFSGGGHLCSVLGLISILDGFGPAGLGVPVGLALLCLVLYPLMESPLHRFLSVLAVPLAASIWLLSRGEPTGMHLVVLLATLGAGWLLTARPCGPTLRPLAYALAVSSLGSVLFVVTEGRAFALSREPATLIVAGGLVLLQVWLAESPAALCRGPRAVGLVATLLLAVFSTPGVLLGIGFLMLGFARRDRPLLALGVIFLPVFLSAFYYEMSGTLLAKAWILMGSGAVLLLARAALGWLSTREEVPA